MVELTTATTSDENPSGKLFEPINDHFLLYDSSILYTKF